MAPGSKIYDEFLTYRLTEAEFFATAQVLAGVKTAARKEQEIAEFKILVDAKRTESRRWSTKLKYFLGII